MIYYFVTELAGFTIYIVTTREVDEDGFLSLETEDFYRLVEDTRAVKGRDVKVLWL